jgi:hypothetical protein
MRKFVCVLITVLLVAFFLAGCGSDYSSEEKQAEREITQRIAKEDEYYLEGARLAAGDCDRDRPYLYSLEFDPTESPYFDPYESTEVNLYVPSQADKEFDEKYGLPKRPWPFHDPFVWFKEDSGQPGLFVAVASEGYILDFETFKQNTLTHLDYLSPSNDTVDPSSQGSSRDMFGYTDTPVDPISLFDSDWDEGLYAQFTSGYIRTWIHLDENTFADCHYHSIQRLGYELAQGDCQRNLPYLYSLELKGFAKNGQTLPYSKVDISDLDLPVWERFWRGERDYNNFTRSYELAYEDSSCA